MAAAPPISVVIPTRDTRELLVRCLETLETWGAEVEIVVVDDGSRDGSAEAARQRHPQIHLIELAEPRGFSAAANRGLAAARGEILLLLNSDTEVEPEGRALLAAAFAADPRLGALGAALRYPDGRAQWSGGAAPTLPWLFALGSGLPRLLAHLPGYRSLRPPAGSAGGPVEWVSGAALALRRAAWEEAGPLDEGYGFYAQDLDLCLRLGARGWWVAVEPRFRVLHHHGASVGSAAGATAARENPALLWTDLLRWAEIHRGRNWARRAALVLAIGARLRLAGRRLAAPFQPAARRSGWRRDNAALQAAMCALTAWRRRVAERPPNRAAD